MSTRSRIGILLPDDSILSVYHHWDGYPEWLGVTLKEHFNSYENASELIDGGNMGCCYSDEEYNYSIRHKFDENFDKMIDCIVNEVKIPEPEVA